MLVRDLWSHTLGQGEVVSAEWRPLVIRLLEMHLKTNDPFKAPFAV